MVLSDLSLWKLLNDLVRDPEPDPDLVNPASIDVRVGREMLLEVGAGEFRAVDLTAGPVALGPGELAVVPTLEWLAVPQSFAVELTLKGLGASHGLAQSMVTWLEPGWCGVATLELRNVTRHTPVPIERGMRLAHLVVHPLDQPAVRPRREAAVHVEGRRG
jgi:deoxycytidine triphosphate deaminase